MPETANAHNEQTCTRGSDLTLNGISLPFSNRVRQWSHYRAFASKQILLVFQKKLAYIIQGNLKEQT